MTSEPRRVEQINFEIIPGQEVGRAPTLHPDFSVEALTQNVAELPLPPTVKSGLSRVEFQKYMTEVVNSRISA